jgi:hypothetical protein
LAILTYFESTVLTISAICLSAFIAPSQAIFWGTVAAEDYKFTWTFSTSTLRAKYFLAIAASSESIMTRVTEFGVALGTHRNFVAVFAVFGFTYLALTLGVVFLLTYFALIFRQLPLYWNDLR